MHTEPLFLRVGRCMWLWAGVFNGELCFSQDRYALLHVLSLLEKQLYECKNLTWCSQKLQQRIGLLCGKMSSWLNHLRKPEIFLQRLPVENIEFTHLHLAKNHAFEVPEGIGRSPELRDSGVRRGKLVRINSAILEKLEALHGNEPKL